MIFVSFIFLLPFYSDRIVVSLKSGRVKKPFVASSFAIFSPACSTPPFEESNGRKEREKQRGMKTKTKERKLFLKVSHYGIPYIISNWS